MVKLVPISVAVVSAEVILIDACASQFSEIVAHNSKKSSCFFMIIDFSC